MKVTYLPLEERLKWACYHSSGAMRPNWRLDSEGRHMVCSLCGKPAPSLVFRICAECGIQFVLPLDDPNWEPATVILSSGKVVERTVFCPPCY